MTAITREDRTSTISSRMGLAMIPLIAAGALSAIAGWSGHAAYARQALNAARCDPVTGLPVRTAWNGQASRMLRGREARTVGLIDLDRFKHVNDTYGHATGDKLLAATAARLRSWVDRVGGGVCGRLGGDEFAVITRRRVTEAEAAELAAVLAGPVALPGYGHIPTTASVGITVCTGRHGLSAGLATADAAMYQAKRDGSGYRIASAASQGPQPALASRARTRHHGPPGSPAAPSARAATAGGLGREVSEAHPMEITGQPRQEEGDTPVDIHPESAEITATLPLRQSAASYADPAPPPARPQHTHIPGQGKAHDHNTAAPGQPRAM